MEIKELRIGNYLNILDSVIEELFELDILENSISLDLSFFEVYSFDKDEIFLYLDDVPMVFDYDDLEPIPLTEEWLIKFGFVREGKRNMWIKDKVCVVLMDYSNLRGESTGNKFYIGFKDMGNVVYHTQFEVPYVHTLQNAYSLTGEELQIIE